MLPSDPFFRTSVPPEHRTRDPERARRVLLFAEIVQAALDGRVASLEARMHFGAAGMAYLDMGGDLARDHLRIAAPRSSRHNPRYLWRLMQQQQSASSRGETPGEELDNIGSDVTEGTE